MLLATIDRLEYLESLHESLTGTPRRYSIVSHSVAENTSNVTLSYEQCIPVEDEVQIQKSPESGFEEVFCTDENGR